MDSPDTSLPPGEPRTNGSADSRPAFASKTRAALLGVSAWLWVAVIGGVYLDAYLPGLFRPGDGRPIPATGWSFPGEAAGALVLALGIVGIAWLTGRAVGILIGLWRGDAGEQTVALLGGLALIGMGVFALGCVGLLQAGSLAVFLILAGVASAWIIWSEKKRRHGSPPLPESPLSGPTSARRGIVEFVLAALCAAALAVSLGAALAPAVESDGMRYHLYGPQEYLRRGGIHYIPFSAFTNFPFLAEMLFGMGLAFSGDILAKLMHWVFLPLSGLLTAALAGRMVSGDAARRQRAALLGAALFVSTPVAAIVAGWSFIDLAVTAFLLGLLWCLVRLRERGSRWGDYAAAGFFAGAAVGCKYTCLAPAGLAFLLVAIHARPWHCAAGRRNVGVFVLAAMLCSAPWFIKNLVYTGNPVYPLGYSIFGGGEWSAEAAQSYSLKAGEKGAQRGMPGDLLLAPFDTAFYWTQFEAQNPGPGYLLLFPWLAVWGLAAWRQYGRGKGRRSDTPRNGVPCCDSSLSAVRRVTGFALFCGVIFFMAYKSNRFLLPVWACLAASGGALAVTEFSRYPAQWGVWRRWLRPETVVGVVMVLASCHGVLWTWRYLAFDQYPPPYRAAGGWISREDYRQAALNYYPAVQWLELHARPGEKVFYIGEHRGYPSRIPVTVSDWFDVPCILHYIRSTDSNGALFDRLRAEGHAYVLHNAGELALYRERYFRPRFSAEEWGRFVELLQSPRLKRAVAWGEHLVIYRISDDGTLSPTPQAAAQANPPASGR